MILEQFSRCIAAFEALKCSSWAGGETRRHILQTSVEKGSSFAEAIRHAVPHAWLVLSTWVYSGKGTKRRVSVGAKQAVPSQISTSVTFAAGVVTSARHTC